MAAPHRPTRQRTMSHCARLGPMILAAALLAAALCASGCAAANRITPCPEGTDPCGTFQRVEGVGILTLWGTPYERGLAHGRLLAQGVLDMVDTICGTNLVTGGKEDYERLVLPLVERFAFDPSDELEMEGILAGVRERMGDGAVLKRLGRPLTLADLKAYNTAGDWYRQACSSFAAWGSLASGGHTWVGRNFDFTPSSAFFPHQMIVVHKSIGSKRAWATVSAPGMIGCITGINSEGVFASTHDVFLPLQPLGCGYVPRLALLRRLMENVSAGGMEHEATAIFESSPQMFDQAILLAAPASDASAPALVFECGPASKKDGNVTVRRPGDDENALGAEAIVCTNHFRKRDGPRSDMAYYRYPLIQQVLAAKTRRQESVDFTVARKTMGAASLPITVHTVIADLDTLDFWYAAGSLLSAPKQDHFVKLPMKEWLTGE